MTLQNFINTDTMFSFLLQHNVHVFALLRCHVPKLKFNFNNNAPRQQTQTDKDTLHE